MLHTAVHAVELQTVQRQEVLRESRRRIHTIVKVSGSERTLEFRGIETLLTSILGVLGHFSRP